MKISVLLIVTLSYRVPPEMKPNRFLLRIELYGLKIYVESSNRKYLGSIVEIIS